MKVDTYHSCISHERRSYQKTIANQTDEELIAMMNSWREFKRPLTENPKIWRLFCGIARREATRRGLIPAPGKGA